MALDGASERVATARRACVVMVLALLAAACGSSPTSASATTTQTFSGTLAAHATAVFPFTVAQDGAASLTLTSLSPQTTITVGLGLGVPSTTADCSLLTVYEAAAVGYVLSGPISAGTYCVAIYDVGNVVVSDNYVLTLTHS